MVRHLGEIQLTEPQRFGATLVTLLAEKEHGMLLGDHRLSFLAAGFSRPRHHRPGSTTSWKALHEQPPIDLDLFQPRGRCAAPRDRRRKGC